MYSMVSTTSALPPIPPPPMPPKTDARIPPLNVIFVTALTLQLFIFVTLAKPSPQFWLFHYQENFNLGDNLIIIQVGSQPN